MKVKKTAVSATIAAAALAMIAPAAYASTALKVDELTSPLGDVTLTGSLVTGTTVDFKTDFAVPAKCSSSTTAGYVTRGVTVSAGTRIGAITSLTYGGCTMTSLLYPIVISKKGATEWGIYATATPASATQATIPVEIRNVSAQMTSTGAAPYACELGVTGKVTGTFNQNTQVLSITPATPTTYPLTIVTYNGAGTGTPQPAGSGTCAGQLYTGDKVQLIGSSQWATPGIGGIKLQ